MNITFEKKGKKIDTLEQWKELGHPKSEKHWKPGRSAMELARFAIENTTEFEAQIKKVLKECSIPEQDFICEPEAIASLGKGMKRGGCRNHDLLMLGSQGCVIGIEAKVSEPFDKSLREKLDEQSQKHNENKKDTRAYHLLEYFVEPKDHEKAKSIGYQLCAATRGTMYSASQKAFTKAIMLVIVFTGNVKKERNYKDRCKKNDADFDLFVKVINADKNGMIVKGVEGKNVECWIKKVQIEIRKES